MLQFWRNQHEGPVATPIDRPFRLVESGTTSAPVLVPLAGSSGAIAVVLIPDRFHGMVAHNGVTLPAGLHLLRHADRLDFEGETTWAAAAPGVTRAVYAPDVHGDDVYCFISKARLDAGDAIVICPGTPGRACGLISAEPAWTTARAGAARFRCPSCGFDPAAAAWSPTVHPRPTLDRLFTLAAQYAAAGTQPPQQ